MARPKLIDTTAPARKVNHEFDPAAIRERIEKKVRSGAYVDRYGRQITDLEEVDTLVDLALSAGTKDTVRLDACKSLASLTRVLLPRISVAAIKQDTTVHNIFSIEEVE